MVPKYIQSLKKEIYLPPRAHELRKINRCCLGTEKAGKGLEGDLYGAIETTCLGVSAEARKLLTHHWAIEVIQEYEPRELHNRSGSPSLVV